jgi:hypothetical protein
MPVSLSHVAPDQRHERPEGRLSRGSMLAHDLTPAPGPVMRNDGPKQSRARKCSSAPFVFCRIRNREAAGYLMQVYRLTAWMMVSTNFAFTAFSKVQASFVL